MNLKTKIQRGIAFLNEKVPGWRQKISLINLDMSNGHIRSEKHCLLSQAMEANYSKATIQLGLTVKQAGDFGFDTPHDFNDNYDEFYEELTKAWCNALVVNTQREYVIQLNGKYKIVSDISEFPIGVDFQIVAIQ